jgi:hypothetical protein
MRTPSGPDGMSLGRSDARVHPAMQPEADNLGEGKSEAHRPKDQDMPGTAVMASLTQQAQYCGSVTNASTTTWTFYLVQRQPNPPLANLVALVWQTAEVMPTATGYFYWSLDYCFVWGTPGDPATGSTFLEGVELKAWQFRLQFEPGLLIAW